jgi:hypothetical protein
MMVLKRSDVLPAAERRHLMAGGRVAAHVDPVRRRHYRFVVMEKVADAPLTIRVLRYEVLIAKCGESPGMRSLPDLEGVLCRGPDAVENALNQAIEWEAPVFSREANADAPY